MDGWEIGGSEEIDGIGAVGDHRANGFVECGFDFNTNYFSTVKSWVKLDNRYTIAFDLVVLTS